jgi:hypothetical protein
MLESLPYAAKAMLAAAMRPWRARKQMMRFRDMARTC